MLFQREGGSDGCGVLIGSSIFPTITLKSQVMSCDIIILKTAWRQWISISLMKN